MTVTADYAESLKKLHESKAFGNRANIPTEVIRCIEEYNIQSILDFGCGKGNVVTALKETYPNLKVYGYDPGREGFDALPDNVDMIISTDVLEHVEPNLLNETLLDLAKRTNKVMYHLIACHPAKKCLPDGRNAHLIVETPEWWKNKLSTVLGWKMYNENTFEYLAQPKKGPSIQVVKYTVTLEKNGNT
jgi:SAM-dependent methyltransferase